MADNAPRCPNCRRAASSSFVVETRKRKRDGVTKRVRACVCGERWSDAPRLRPAVFSKAGARGRGVRVVRYMRRKPVKG